MADPIDKQLGKYAGSKLQLTGDANKPSYDPVEGMEKKLDQMKSLLEWKRLTEWEKSFLVSIYGVAVERGKLSRKQHITLSKIIKRWKESTA